LAVLQAVIYRIVDQVGLTLPAGITAACCTLTTSCVPAFCLQTIHRSVMQLRKSLAEAADSSSIDAQLKASPAAVAVASTSTGTSLPSSPLGRHSAAATGSDAAPLSPSSANASPRTKNALKFAALEAQAGSATSRSLAVGSALDTSLQAMQAAKLSLLSMHDKDVKLELISQSVQEVLAGGKVRDPEVQTVEVISARASLERKYATTALPAKHK
jgi:hypothetical protein